MRYLLLLAFPLLFPCLLSAQSGVPTTATDYWVGFMPNYLRPADNMELFVGCQDTAVAKVQIYNASGDIGEALTYKLDPYDAVTVEIVSTEVEVREQETPIFKAIHVTSDAPITLYGYSNSDATSDGYFASPTAVLDTSYIIASWYDDNYQGIADPLAGQFMIIAPEDSTRVTIRTTADTRLNQSATAIGHDSGDTWTVTLQRGQCYLVQSTGKQFGVADLTGSSVSSDRPVAVLTGHQRAGIPIGSLNDSKDHLIEMLPPTNAWSTRYHVAPSPSRIKAGSYFRLISGADGNTISYSGKGTYTLNKGEYVDRPQVLEPEVYFSTNSKPFLVVQYEYTQGELGDPGGSDPSMYFPAADGNGSLDMIFRTPQSANSSHGAFTHYLQVNAPKWCGPIELSKGTTKKTLQAWGATKRTNAYDSSQSWTLKLGTDMTTYRLTAPTAVTGGLTG